MCNKFLKCLGVACLALLVAGLMTPAFGQILSDKSTVIGTAHDSSLQGCSSCHVPHQATARGETLLWVPLFSTTIFGVYDSDTLDFKATEIGDATYSDTNPPRRGIGSFGVVYELPRRNHHSPLDRTNRPACGRQSDQFRGALERPPRQHGVR